MQTKPQYQYLNDPKSGILVKASTDILKTFNVQLLNLGDIRATSHPFDALAVLFDLEGFTAFTRQVDPQLTIPNFISDFLEWLFATVKNFLIENDQAGVLWAELPFFSKFMGDGVLFLWKIDLDSISAIDPNTPSNKLQYLIHEFVCNIIGTMLDVCESYSQFLSKARTHHVNPPLALRCGIARGTVIPIGEGKDFVGACINIAARLQKFNGLRFAFSARGINEQAFSESYKDSFLKLQSKIRGIGDNELIYMRKTEFEGLSDQFKRKFKKP